MADTGTVAVDFKDVQVPARRVWSGASIGI